MTNYFLLVAYKRGPKCPFPIGKKANNYRSHLYQGMVGYRDKSLALVASFSQTYSVMKYSWPTKTCSDSLSRRALGPTWRPHIPLWIFFKIQVLSSRDKRLRSGAEVNF
jgi:hypothetical protein